MKITLYGIPKRAWAMLTGLFSAPAWLILWRLIVLVGFLAAMVMAFAATGGSGVMAIFVAFVFTTLLSQLLADDALAIWRNLWNAEWGEVTI